MGHNSSIKLTTNVYYLLYNVTFDNIRQGGMTIYK